jgi:polar amino acid transport system substrate-binding protein
LAYKGPEQLKGRTVAVYGPSNTSTALDKIKAAQSDMTVDLSPEDDAVFRKLDAGRVGAAFSNRDVGLAIIKRLGLKNVRYAGRSSPLKYYIGFSKESVPEKTVKAFNEAYKKLLASGVIVKILKAYGMVPASLE